MPGAPVGTLLDPYTALDLTDAKGFFCGRLLADLGMSVVKVEPPCGDMARTMPPFVHDEAGPNSGIYWLSYNASKKGVTLDIETAKGQELFLRLVKQVDFVIESFPPGYLAALGLDYPALSRVNSRLIHTAITPFGRTGPYASFAASDIVCLAMGGMLSVTGDEDRPPVRVSAGEQSYLHGGSQAAAATLMAHYARQSSGKGQHIDVSLQESVAWMLGSDNRHWEVNGHVAGRHGGRAQSGRIVRRFIHPCKDGFVTFLIQPSAIGSASMRAIVAWMEEEGTAGLLSKINYDELDMAKVTQEQIDAMEAAFDGFFAAHTKEELFRESIKRRFLVYPVMVSSDLLHDEHLRQRGLFADVRHPPLGVSLTFPGHFFTSCGLTPRIHRAAPLLGEHNEEVYGKLLGLPPGELARLKSERVI